MLFNSFAFLFLFLPVSLLGVLTIGKYSHVWALRALVVLSLVFYAWELPAFLLVLLVSMLFNYFASIAIHSSIDHPRRQKAFLVGAIGCNLAFLFWFKYLGWVLSGLSDIFQGLDFAAPALPLGISFYTFTQIGYLLDLKEGRTNRRGFWHFAIFVTFFPHLIAGPILHYKEIMPQFEDPKSFRKSNLNIAVGLTLFTLGLFKKCVLADPLSAYVGTAFGAPHELGALAAWRAALSYSLQLYFDFSGYSDMAIGLARMFNIRFPLNFNSPYKAASVVEYWQRWHMSLTRYLNLLLYNPVALAIARRRQASGQSTGKAAQRSFSGFFALVAVPTLFTMGLAGIWHGAGLQFVIFGLLHAAYLVINHAWRIWRPEPTKTLLGHVGSVALTYLAVLVGAVFFRASDVGHAMALLAAMSGVNGLGPVPGASAIVQVLLLYLLVFGAPNTQQIIGDYAPTISKFVQTAPRWMRWQPTLTWAAVTAALFVYSVLNFGGTTEFLYFQF